MMMIMVMMKEVAKEEVAKEEVAKVREEAGMTKSLRLQHAGARRKVTSVFLTMLCSLFSILVMETIPMEFVSMQDIVCSSTQASQATSICIVRQIQMKVAEVEAKAKVEVVEAARSPKSKLARARRKVTSVFLTMLCSLFSILVMIIPMEFVSMQVTKACSSTLASQAISTCIAKLWKMICIARLTIHVGGEGAAVVVVVAVKKMKIKKSPHKICEVNLRLILYRMVGLDTESLIPGRCQINMASEII